LPILDHHRNQFDAGTQTKLEIFENYLEAWLPTFIGWGECNQVYICDFFAGPGRDKAGTPGSPLIIIDVINRYMDKIKKKKLKINLVLNEFRKRKFKKLEHEIEKGLPVLSDIQHLLDVRTTNKDFEQLFAELKNELKDKCNLLFFDQSGIKHMTANRVIELEKFLRTDYLFFSASSNLKRFEYEKYFADFSIGEEIKHHDVHRYLLDYYKKKLGPNGRTLLYPFTIKKTGNIYGLIFGSKHIRGADKFLNIAWGENPLNGEANFDIDDDGSGVQLGLFDKPKLSKVDQFKKELRSWVLDKKYFTNEDVYLYTIKRGFLPRFAKELLLKLRKDKKLEHFSHPLVSYDSIYKKNRVITFTVI